MLTAAAHLLTALLPAVLFLICLVWLDSYKLVRLRWILIAIGIGGAMAVIAYLVNATALGGTELGHRLYARVAAPIVEESLKAILVAWLIRTNRVGFLVDATIAGFAVGAGFALVENLYYLGSLADSRMVVWVVRGFGTALLHGGATAIFAIFSRSLTERRGRNGWLLFLPGLLLAVAIHSAFNHFLLSPLYSTLLVLLALPLVFLAVFVHSERALQHWLGSGFDTDAQILEELRSTSFSASPVGIYLQSLRDHFPGEVIADMLCYLRLNAELSLRAKGELMMREAGFASRLESDVREKLQEVRYLEHSIGPTGRLAMLPVLSRAQRRSWEVSLLQDRLGG